LNKNNGEGLLYMITFTNILKLGVIGLVVK